MGGGSTPATAATTPGPFIRADIPAARVLFASGALIRMAGLEATAVLDSTASGRRLAASGLPLPPAMRGLLERSGRAAALRSYGGGDAH